MALMASETAQCECCEAYTRLRDLSGVTVEGDRVQKIIAVEEGDVIERYDSPWIGRCPECLNDIFVRNVC